ncbi:HNH endonuclease [Nodosilinea sp. LEGE 07088]|uniref:HNH endonuclease n=1 Tax=Nodosilinea sp. LEGE 07088 TaxID=2777968 RepID=UPI00187FA5E6|nr:HNH endonuclease [Nodosilinea sp. LEGE 07088]MBE9136362.1 HNH endonuclease [Nodosilinea sp. LEGE 07088]
MASGSDPTLEDLFTRANKVGNRRYHKLTQQDFEDYRRFDYWRYIHGDSECGTTPDSQAWVRDNSEHHCPICGERFSRSNGRSIDHKLPRAQYPWLALDFSNLWVICYQCNQEKAEMHWYEYEHYMFTRHPNRYQDVVFARPRHLLKQLGQK